MSEPATRGRTKVLVDLLFYTGRKGGMESYVREVYSRLHNDATTEYIGLASSELASGNSSWFPGEVIDSGISGENRIDWAQGELFQVARHARRLRVDVIHCPANLGPWRSRLPVVVTLHDLLPFRHPDYVPGWHSRVLRMMIRLATRRAARVITVSNASRADISDVLRLSSSHIDVIPLAGGPLASSAATSPLREPGQVLAVGNRMPHKNLELLIEAIGLIPAPNRPKLVITGSHGDDPLAPVVRAHHLDDWVSLRGWLSAEELEHLYSESTLLAFPSLFEGFGLPLIEAMARGCPVLCADIPVLREVGGSAVSFVDPTDAPAWAGEIERLVDSPNELALLARRGLERAAQFDWGQTAAATRQSLVRAARTS
jgi:glycosyltransferase involved in cell wall biosynthesis